MRVKSNSMFAFFATVLTFQLPVFAQTSPADIAQYFQEAQAICTRDNGKLWGISLCGSILLIDPRTRTVTANQADSEGVLTRDGKVFSGKLPANVNIANTATEWAGVKWTMVMLPLPEDKYGRANLMAHELWHRVQDEIGFPSSGAANNHLDSRDGRIWLQLEWRALSAALTSRGSGQRQAVSDALLFRAFRRTMFPQAASQEREMEMHEGLAEYTGVKLSGHPNLNEYMVQALKEAAQGETFVRSFAYASGPVYGILLDQSKSGWRRNLKKADDLGLLLQSKLRIKLSENIKETCETRAKYYDGDKLQAAETERENNRRKILADYRARLVDGPVLAIPVQKMNMQFNPGILVPLDSVGTVYPDIRVVDVWGILTVARGGALINSTYSKIYVPAPNSLNKPRLQGDGWTLELNPGWTIAVGERKGDYVIKVE